MDLIETFPVIEMLCAVILPFAAINETVVLKFEFTFIEISSKLIFETDPSNCLKIP